MALQQQQPDSHDAGAVAFGGVALAPCAPGPLTLIAPQRGRGAEVSAWLTAQYGLTWPEVGQSDGLRGDPPAGDAPAILWFDHAHALLMGAPLHDVGVLPAAFCDVSDGWHALRLSGAQKGEAEEVLARLVPLDLRASSFATGATARSLLVQCPLSLTRLDENAFLLLVPASMARWALGQIHSAMKTHAARTRLNQT